MTSHYLNYRGNITALCSKDNKLAFVTNHTEQRATALYELDPDKMQLSETALPSGATALLADSSGYWMIGSDHTLIQLSAKAKKPKTFPIELSDLHALAILSNGNLALLGKETLAIFDQKNGIIQTISLEHEATSIATDSSGKWIAVGAKTGHVTVFESEEKDEFTLSASDKLHEGAVTSLLFEPEDLRFFSAGIDGKILHTHARGTLEPEDRGRSYGHEDRVSAMILAPGDRFISAGLDGVCKSWIRSGGTRPATLAEGLTKAVYAISFVELHGRAHLVAACHDQSLRLFLVDATGKFSHATHKVFDAYHAANKALSDTDAPTREKAITDLSTYSDKRSIKLLESHIQNERDHEIRLKTVNAIAGLDHGMVAASLENFLSHSDKAIRVAALDGLRAQLGEKNLHPLKLALDHETIGPVAVMALAKLAKSDDQAMTMLMRSLQNKQRETRISAIEALETLYPDDSSEPSLLSLDSKHADVRELAIVRLFQRKLLSEGRVRSALRRAGDDPNESVRKIAFHVSLLSSEKLTLAIRSRSAQFHRQIWQIEQLEGTKKEKAPPKIKESKLDLEPADYTPLVQAMASSTLDTSLLGAQALALLGDNRALGLLLQLSRVDSAEARVQVSKALASLGNERAIQRLILMLNDSTEHVRDVSYSGLAKIYQKAPLTAAESGLKSEHADIRRRGLHSLVSVIKKKKPSKEGEQSWDLLIQTLHDSDLSIRTESFKTILNQEIGGGDAGSLRLALTSSQADIRREVLTELMAQVRQPWAWDLLLEFYNDPSKELRSEAFEFAVKHTKSRKVAPIEKALFSEYSDLRQGAVKQLSKLATNEAQQALAKSINDEDEQTRHLALDHLISSQALELVRKALKSDHLDTRIRAANALAKGGDITALEPLLESASQKKPTLESEFKEWEQQVVESLRGLEFLGDSQVVELVFTLLKSDSKKIQKAASKTLVMTTSAEHNDLLTELLSHESTEVRTRAALALTLNGEAPPTPQEILEKILSTAEMIEYSLCREQEIGIIPFFNIQEHIPTTLALLILFEASSLEAEPHLAMAALAAKHYQIRYVGAELVEAYANQKSLDSYLEQVFNKEEWDIPLKTLKEVSFWLEAAPRTRLRLIEILPLLDEEKPERWNLAWQSFQERFGKAPKPKGKAKKRPPLDEMQDLSFGTFVGLARDTSLEEPIRKLSLNHLIRLGKRDALNAATVSQTLAPFLSDTYAGIRKLSFDGLISLKAEADILASDCLESGQMDMGVEGLKLLSSGSAAQSKKILLEVALTRDDALSLEAATLLEKKTNPLSAGVSLLEARYEATRSTALSWIIQVAGEDQKGIKALQSALKSKHQTIRLSSAVALAKLKDKSAYEALFEQLNNSRKREQYIISNSLLELGDERTPEALLGWVTTPNQGDVEVELFFNTIASFRATSVVPKLLSLMEDKNYLRLASQAILKISGYDQPIPWDWDRDSDDFEWMKSEHPRHDEVLAQLLEKSVEVNAYNSSMIANGVTISRSNAVDPVLAALSHHTDDELRNAALKSLAWRLSHRKAPSDSLITALSHKDPSSQFIAAEGLARARFPDGMSILLAAIELSSDLNQRIHAVEALGELGDERALDVILKLADENEHALQEAATEAIGHMGSSDQAEAIYKILSRLAKSTDGIATRAMKGLRWFDTREGWELIKERAKDHQDYTYYEAHEAAIEALGYHDDEASRELLLSLFESSEDPEELLKSARRSFGKDSLEPDYALAKSEYLDPEDEDVIKRLLDNGEPARIIEVLPFLEEELQAVFTHHLLENATLSAKEAKEALESKKAVIVTITVKLLGRRNEHSNLLKGLLKTWIELWQTEEEKSKGSQYYSGNPSLSEIQDCLKALLWVAGRQGAEKEILEAATTPSKIDQLTSVLKTSLQALSSLGKLSKAAVSLLSDQATSPQAEIRELAVEILLQHAPKQAQALSKGLISDRASFQSVARHSIEGLKPVLLSHASHPNYQAITLPSLIKNGEYAVLLKTALDLELSEISRIGAIEALSAMCGIESEKALETIGKNEKLDEEFRKAAWRGLRRSKRARQKQQTV